MITGHDGFVRPFGTAHFADHVPNCAVLVILFEVHFYFHRAGTNVVGVRQRPLPIARGLWAAQMLENRRSAGVRERYAGNLGHSSRIFWLSALFIRKRWQGGNARRSGIAGEIEDESY